jgi:hypothetical protein
VIRKTPHTWPVTARTAAAIIAAASLILPVMVFGSSQAFGRSSHSTNTQRALAYSRCMRSHGVPNFPEPNSSGAFPKVTPQQLGVSPSVFQSAQKHCRYLLPDSGNGPSQTQTQKILNGMLKFAKCMRSHGVSNWPDPVVDAGGNPEFYLDGEIDQNSPQIKRDINACLHWIPSEALSPGNPIACSGRNPGGGPGCGACSCRRQA